MTTCSDMKCSCTLVSLLLALHLFVVVKASVGESFEECKKFLYKGTPPVGLEDHSLKKICQRFESKPRFATLYDTVDHIPVYSAYTFKRSDGVKRVDVPWMYEPQLASAAGKDEMQPFPRGNVHQNFEDTQAVLEDYGNAVSFERGHLNPDPHQADPDDKAATYTLTNVVPQVREFNIGPWSRHEDIIRQRLNNYCRGTAYVVTGVTTSGNMIRRNNFDRVAIPTYMWSAYCCTNYDRNAPYSERYKFPAFAAYGLNDRVNNHVVELTVKKLENILKSITFVDKNFQIFYRDCIP
ncbi:endonuclease domain-containing 1 protein [Amia ocellicauda]|uniref:endonuclease domain-containing 1 protein n=1 Tax=Amia ocellicauda TaxID=2972642 RepID=UPI00346390EA